MDHTAKCSSLSDHLPIARAYRAIGGMRDRKARDEDCCQDCNKDCGKDCGQQSGDRLHAAHVEAVALDTFTLPGMIRAVLCALNSP